MPDRFVRRLNGPRGSFLLGGTLLCLAHSVAYLPAPPSMELPMGLQVLGEVVPLRVYGGLWLLVALVAFFGSFQRRSGRQRDHADAWSFGGVMGMCTVWGLSYMAGWLLSLVDGVPSRSWISGTMYLSVALLVACAARMTNPSSGRTRA